MDDFPQQLLFLAAKLRGKSRAALTADNAAMLERCAEYVCGLEAERNVAHAAETKIDLTPFCGALLLSRPRLMDGMAYATDKRVLIRCDPSRAKPFTYADGLFPSLALIMADIGKITKWGRVEVEPCDKCNSKGYLVDELGDYSKVCECYERYVGAVPVAARYLYLINKLPGITWQLDAKPPGPVYFRFEHGDGLLMGLGEE